MSEIFTVTTHDLIEQVAERWANQYPYSSVANSRDSARKIYTQLLALPKNATKEQVEKIIGNSSWTRERCGECGEEVEGVAVLGDRNSDCRARICLTCLKKAATALETNLTKGTQDV